jgi:PAS domain S-box-containing protein
MNAANQSSKRLFIFLAITISLIIAVGTYAYYVSQKQSIVREKKDDLQAIASLKADQLSQWYKERIADANVLVKSPFFVQAAQRLKVQGITTLMEKDFYNKLLLFNEYYGYDNLILADTAGHILVSVTESDSMLDDITARQIKQAIVSDDVYFTGIYFCPQHNKFHYDIIVPVRTGQTNPMLVVIIRIDPEDLLFPIINTWPTESQTAESLIVKREGDYAVFVNSPRFSTARPKQLKVPLTDTLVPAVKAILGFTGFVEGDDYRGEAVLSYVHQLKDMPWYMVVKMDESELYKELNFRTGIILLTGLLLIIITSASLVSIYSFRQRGFYKYLLAQELALTTSETRNRTTLYSIGDAVITTDTNGLVLQMNPVAERLTGWNEKEAVGKPIGEMFNIIAEDSRQAMENPVERVLAEGKVVGLANHTLLINKQGNETPIADSGAPIVSKEGKTLGVVLVFRDQTAEREAQRALEQSEERYALVMAASEQGMWDWHVETNEVFYSKQWKKQIGYEDHELKNDFSTWIEHLHPDERESCQKAVYDYLEHPVEHLMLEFRFRHKDGSYRWIHNKASSITNKEGKVIRLFGIHSDFTKRKQAEIELLEKQQAIEAQNEEYYALNEEYMTVNEELKTTNEHLQAAVEKAQESDHLKTAFLNNLSHEIRTPLNAIIGFGEFLGNPDLDSDEQSKFVGIIQKNGFQLAGIINDIVSMATIEAGQEVLRETETNIQEVIEVVHQQYLKATNQKGLEFSIENILNEEEAQVISDETKLTQMLGNLVGNAIKFTEKGRIKINCSLKGEQLHFTVSDTGMGIDEKHHAFIFERFRQIEPDSSKLYGGNGLGLAITKAYAELMGGEIWVESSPGKGSRFHFTIAHKPLNKKEEKTMSTTKELEKADKKTILIVEDEYSNYFFLELMFSKMGITPIVAHNGQEAIDICKSNPEIDLILMDLKMPVLNGFEATKQIKAMRPELPIIAQTAYALSADKHKAIEAGCDDYLTKPIRKQDLMVALARYL